ncbi:hypothetical protein A2159_00920 [Candidatus Woesebacteria bacterium RBG_13_34_9]|uniref:ABC transporter permease n=1 Tax=Candidatus Woesebacteria bacterium RBG_13_34_9 TaxID=1802477 RepID=A0A1F7X532_9BACT|nr:MAG: hypothetical protein A2159_00920 [Candidatus Woesebacteria bacterium RBG_13_34_9]
MKKIFYYFNIWILMSRNSFMSYLSNKLVISIFLIGKILRFIFFFAFIYFLISKTKNLAGYNLNQTIFFFLTFNLVDITTQFFFREAYKFRQLLVTGDFDLMLIKPVNVLFRVLMGGADLLDFITIPAIFIAVVIYGKFLEPSFFQILIYILLMINAFIIAASFHIIILAFGILTLEVDNTIMIYRDLMSLGKFPVDIYLKPLKEILTFLIPVGLIATLPSKALMGLLTTRVVLFSFFIGFFLIFVSLKFWAFALRKYSSASS